MPASIHSSKLFATIVGVAATVATLTADARQAHAATGGEAMKWLAGRWTSDGNCKGAWIRFDRKGAGWTYRELAYEKGKPFPATVSADDAGVVTVRIMVPDGEYDYINTFKDRNSFDATESFSSADSKGEPSMKSYTRCR